MSAKGACVVDNEGELHSVETYCIFNAFCKTELQGAKELKD